MLDVNVSDHSKTLDISAVNLNRPPNQLQEVHINQVGPPNFLPVPSPTMISPVLPSLDYQESAEQPRIKLGNNLGNNLWPENGINFPAVPSKNNNGSNFLADLPRITGSPDHLGPRT